MNFQTLLYDPLYAALGTDAVIRSVYFDEFAVRAIDKSSGVAVSGSGSDTGTGVGLQTIVPAAIIMMKSLVDAGISREDIEGGIIEINGKNWFIKATLPKPSPDGEDAGELYLILMENENG